MSTVLVNGGAGYIGSHAVKALRAAGHTVVVFDNLSAGHAAAVGDATLVEGDVRDTAQVEATLRRHAVTAVMHFAALLSVGESVREPARYYDHNVRGSLSVLDAMMAVGVHRLVLSSTCAVYGDPVTTPIDEDHPTNPINAYGESKLVVERALAHYGRAYGLRTIALRYFNAAGADAAAELGEDHNPEIHLIPRAIAAACGGAPLKVFGDDYPTADGTCERDYVHVSDSGVCASAGAGGAGHRGGDQSLQSWDGAPPFGARSHPGGRACDRASGSDRTGAAAARRPGGALRLGRPDRPGARLATGVCAARRGGRDRLALACRASSGV